MKAKNEVDHFILQEIETVPHLEALLLIWNSRPQPWTVANLSKRLYIPEDAVRALLDDLCRRQLAVRVENEVEAWGYFSKSEEHDSLLADVDSTYRRELVRVSTMIHSKPSASIREFVSAFRITREQK